MNTKRIVGIIASLALVVIVGFIAYQLGVKHTKEVYATGAAKEVAASYVSSLSSGNIDKAYGLGSAYYKSKNTPTDIQSFSDTLNSNNVKISDEEIYVGRDQASGQAIYLAVVDNLPPSKTGSTSGKVVVRLVYENNLWRVDSISVS